MSVDTPIVENKPPPSKVRDRKAYSPKRIKQGQLRLSSLVVDDDSEILKYTAQMLARLGGLPGRYRPGKT
ncbi:hypothetical protein DSCO28_37650 [Desulfosarcina ovata subsp. sediminis]|uniref:Uncharacterized protein n=1 Tax=Desulfosarcina ovata subsp. sediminis TaxID=885957 RepID=A0A5K7ZSK9_9BACT|nr:hypothetical protein [Desulfosarcina ovata]BBO83199.1 hypothetical protein DSCO28_37650 [Desulfosarcina ovata subsp. sediminis]